jgi:hypothetical protein
MLFYFTKTGSRPLRQPSDLSPNILRKNKQLSTGR